MRKCDLCGALEVDLVPLTFSVGISLGEDKKECCDECAYKINKIINKNNACNRKRLEREIKTAFNLIN